MSHPKLQVLHAQYQIHVCSWVVLLRDRAFAFKQTYLNDELLALAVNSHFPSRFFLLDIIHTSNMPKALIRILWSA
jgi:hypothetical protein